MLENIFLVASILGFLISLTMMSDIFKTNKANFFIGLIVFMIALELLFSWAVVSGYTQDTNAFAFWKYLNYLIFPPAIYLFVKFNTDDNFQIKPWHYILFLPALVEYFFMYWSATHNISLRNYPAWIWFSDYLPMIGTIAAITYFWVKYYKLNTHKTIKTSKVVFMSQLRLLLLMGSLTLICAMWLAFNFVGWKHYEYIEFTITFLFIGFALLNFLENRQFPSMAQEEKNEKFPNYNDEENLALLETSLKENQFYLKPNFPLKEFALELQLPARYVSYLINHYHHKNYNEFINQYRIDAFLNKAKTSEKDSKTLLGLALDSGFSSKSTFNQVFKNHTGKTPSEYLKA